MTIPSTGVSGNSKSSVWPLQRGRLISGPRASPARLKRPQILLQEKTDASPHLQKSILVAGATGASLAFLIMCVTSGHMLAQGYTPSSLVVRVAVFSSDQGRLDDYREFVHGHLFPTLRTIPGYVATLLGREANSGQLISLSFWRSEADAQAGEDAVGRAIRALPHGSAPRPAKVEKYVIEFRDIKEPISN